MAGFGGACRRGRLGVEAGCVMDSDGGNEDNQVLDNDGGDEEHTVMDRVGGENELGLDSTSGDNDGRGDEHTLVQEGTSDRECSWVDRVVSTTSISQSISHSFDSWSTKTPLSQMHGRLTHLVSQDPGFSFGTDVAAGSES